MSNTSLDSLNRYMFEQADVRGQMVQLEQSYQRMLQGHDYPLALQRLMGELLCATSLLTATLKFEGDIAVQLQGDGPVSLAVVNGTQNQEMRGVAHYQGSLKDDANLTDLIGKGHMVITITPDKGERYQGVVALDQSSIAACLESYFERSEQLPTNIWLFADGQHAAGMLLQVLPGKDSDLAGFEHLAQLTNTISAKELFELDAENILHRLYHQEDLRLFDAVAVEFKCRCSRERSAAAIRSIDRQELESILADMGHIALDCDYCGTKYEFDSIDVAALFDGNLSDNHTH
ncbi:Hsp33 family molecular chaperone HslO [Paraferrimonas sedimenticola]|uniref:33 kDa chaperonin n=1 Tax=Paraferrimonas sedimenticola TaxID=375674 RepID=A0AA37RVW9_9GAMM|nr:Hsp33 family molecular chaperone HslO [Paraferrimonas sedimenticola]GLP95928.1 33 kDa chaperonin [Paraferrimonas sedimenticola]